MTTTTNSITIRRGEDRGTSQFGWLNSRHSFSFGEYYDPGREQFGALRVINDDIVAGGGGFPSHPHRDMEILTWMLDGKLRHRDSMGHEDTLQPGELQAMSAGTGIMHSEFNDSKTQPLRLLQIWLFPDKKNYPPGYDQRAFPIGERHNQWLTVASGHPTGEALAIHQDATLSVARLDAGASLPVTVSAGRHGYLHVARGGVKFDQTTLADGDALELTGAVELKITALGDGAEVLFFDLV